MDKICYPSGYRSDGKRMLKTFESGDIFRLASGLNDNPDKLDEIFGMALDINHETCFTRVLVLDMLKGHILELEGSLYAQPCPDATLRVKSGHKGIRIISRDSFRERPICPINIPVGDIFETGTEFICHDGERVPALYMRTGSRRYENDDLLITCVNLFMGTTFEIDAYKLKNLIRYEDAALCPYGYVEGHMRVGDTK